jgi:acyl carrier protein
MNDRLPEEALRRAVAEVAAAYGVGEERVRSTLAFRSFLGADSLDVIKLILALDDELRGGGFKGPALRT